MTHGHVRFLKRRPDLKGGNKWVQIHKRFLKDGSARWQAMVTVNGKTNGQAFQAEERCRRLDQPPEG